LTDVPATGHLPRDTGNGGRHNGRVMTKISGNNIQLKNGRQLMAPARNRVGDKVAISTGVFVSARWAD